MRDGKGEEGKKRARKKKNVEEEAGLKKGRWTPEEDAILLELVKKHGSKNWSAIRSANLLNRSGKSCRLRWMNRLRPDLKCGQKFTEEEKEIMIEKHALFPNQYSKIAVFVPGRTDNDVKNFIYSLKRKLERRQRQLEERRSGKTPASISHSAETTSTSSEASETDHLYGWDETQEASTSNLHDNENPHAMQSLPISDAIVTTSSKDKIIIGESHVDALIKEYYLSTTQGQCSQIDVHVHTSCSLPRFNRHENGEEYSMAVPSAVPLRALQPSHSLDIANNFPSGMESSNDQYTTEGNGCEIQEDWLTIMNLQDNNNNACYFIPDNMQSPLTSNADMSTSHDLEIDNLLSGMEPSNDQYTTGSHGLETGEGGTNCYLQDENAACWSIPNENAACWSIPNENAACWSIPNENAACLPIPNENAACLPIPNENAACLPIPNENAACWSIPDENAACWSIPDENAACWSIPNDMQSPPTPNADMSTSHDLGIANTLVPNGVESSDDQYIDGNLLDANDISRFSPHEESDEYYPWSTETQRQSSPIDVHVRTSYSVPWFNFDENGEQITLVVANAVPLRTLQPSPSPAPPLLRLPPPLPSSPPSSSWPLPPDLP